MTKISITSKEILQEFRRAEIEPGNGMPVQSLRQNWLRPEREINDFHNALKFLRDEGMVEESEHRDTFLILTLKGYEQIS